MASSLSNLDNNFAECKNGQDDKKIQNVWT